jgi:hypothetical protein
LVVASRKGTSMTPSWIADYKQTSKNALTVDWFVSPLEYAWGNGRAIAERAFPAPSVQSAGFDEILAPKLYQVAMTFDFRAKMMVYAFMREPIAKTQALEIESGLMHLFGLNFMSCLSQWIYVVEGYCRNLFRVRNMKKVESRSWTIPTTGDITRDNTIRVVCKALGDYLDNVVYKHTSDMQTKKLNRHLMLHGNRHSAAFYSQKNCLSLMFVLDALVFVEMVKNGHFPQIFQDGPGEPDRISRRKRAYSYEMEHALQPQNLLKISLLDEHL